MSDINGSAPILIVGLGNILLKDEGFGVHVIKQLMQEDLGPNVEIFEGATIGIGILGELENREKIIIVDALKTVEEPGTIFMFQYADIEKYYHDDALSLHQLDFIESLEIAEFLGKKLPEIVIIGIQPKSIELDMEMSEEIKVKIPDVITLIYSEIGH